MRVSVAEFGLGLQEWLGAEPYDPDRVLAFTWPTRPTEKPPQGFFTSSWDEERQTSAWSELFATMPRAATESRTTYLLQPHADALLYVIDTPEGYERLAETYPQVYETSQRPPRPHWKRLAAEELFDAVHMTAAAVSDKSHWYAHSWGVESTLWLRPKLTLLDPS